MSRLCATILLLIFSIQLFAQSWTSSIPADALKRFPAKFITSLAPDGKGGFYAGTEEKGVIYAQKDAKKTWQFRQFTQKDGFPATDNVYTVCRDRQGRIWAGTDRFGVAVFNGQKWKTYDLNTAAKALQVVGVFLSVGMQIKDDIDQEKAAKQLRQARNDIRSGTLEIAQSISREFHAQVNGYVHQVFNTEISRVNQSLGDLEELISNKKQYFAAMNEFQTRSSLLIDRIHTCR